MFDCFFLALSSYVQQYEENWHKTGEWHIDTT